MSWEDSFRTLAIMGTGLIGLVGAVFTISPPKSRWTKASLIAVFCTLAAVSIMGEIGSGQIESSQKATQQARKQKLDDLIAEGEAIMGRCALVTFYRESEQDWIVRTESFLDMEFGRAYVRMFQSGAGLQSFSAPTACAAENRDIWEGLNSRVTRLQEFGRE